MVAVLHLICISSLFCEYFANGLPVSSSTGDNNKNETAEYLHYLDQMKELDPKHPEVADALKHLAFEDNLDNPEQEEALWSSELRNRPDEEKRIRIERLLQAYNTQLLRGSPNSRKITKLNEKEREQQWQKAVEEYNKWDQIEDELYQRHKKMKHNKMLKHLKESYGAGYDQVLEEIKQTEEHRQDYPKFHEPGSVPQMKEVDDLGPEDPFDPVVFHRTHDLNGDGVLDPIEVEAFVNKELTRAYNESSPDFDPAVLDHEIVQMRKHVISSFDTNGDLLITLDEFVKRSSNPEVQRDDGWDSSIDDRVFSQEEMEQLAKARQDTTTKPIDSPLQSTPAKSA